MKPGFPIVFFLLTIHFGFSQDYLQRLKGHLANAKDDTTRMFALCALAEYHEYMRPDSNIYYVRQCVDLADKIDRPDGKLFANNSLFFTTNLKANYIKALEIAQNNLSLASTLKKDRFYYMAIMNLTLSLVSREMGDGKSSENYQKNALSLQQRSGRMDGDFWGWYGNKAISFSGPHLDSALYYMTKARWMAHHSRHYINFGCLATAQLADIYRNFGQYPMARHYYQEALQEAIEYDNVYIQSRVYRDLAIFFNTTGNPDSCIYFAQLGLQLCRKYNFGDYASRIDVVLANLYESQRKPDSALKYMHAMLQARDSIFSQARMQQFESIIFEEEQKQKEINLEQERFESRVKLYVFIFIAAILSLVSYILFRNNKLRKRSYLLLKKQKQLTDDEKEKVQETLEELKNTQAQLVHSEKMASLGEITAGIAHEIQNPLNFVNNFSELNMELSDELKKDLNDIYLPSEQKAGLEMIINNILQNQEKIVHHGKRADAIVKAMLEHSRTNAGHKEPRDINTLVQEYLRLSYHGFKAKNQSFEAETKVDLDEMIGMIGMVSQDIGRVLVNLLNNAFYSIHMKKKSSGTSYHPLVYVTTKKVGQSAEIRIRDNGLGIPQKILSKIFQPFYTTKPTGQGTGLGLSLSYDIIKAHGGDLRIDTEEGEYAEFTMVL